jgi:hypothetical protein
MRTIRRKTGPITTTSLMQQDDDMWDDRDEILDEEEDERRVVILRDVAMDRVIECFVDREIEIEGRKYATLMPADTPVILAQVIYLNIQVLTKLLTHCSGLSAVSSN